MTVEDKVSTDKSCLIDLFRFHVIHFLPFSVPMSDRESNTSEGQLDSKPVASHTRLQSMGWTRNEFFFFGSAPDTVARTAIRQQPQIHVAPLSHPTWVQFRHPASNLTF